MSLDPLKKKIIKSI